MMTDILPRWDLSNVYPSLESQEFDLAMKSFSDQITALDQAFSSQAALTGPGKPVEELSRLVGELIDSLNRIYTLAGTLNPYITSFVAVNSRDNLAKRKFSEYEQVSVRLRKLTVQFQSWIGTLAPILDQIIETNQSAREHAFALREAAQQSRFLMSEVEEALAADLSLSGAGAWGKLQGTVTSQLAGDIQLDGEVRSLPLPAIINLHSHPDEAVRKAAYALEIALLDSVREPLAACMNGVKGSVIILNKRRGREDALHSAIDQARIDRATLETMLAAMEASFPAFRRYYLKKAQRLGKEKLPWYDIWAPVSVPEGSVPEGSVPEGSAPNGGAPNGGSKKMYSFKEAQEFILTHFASFSSDLASMAKRAFKNLWIDAEQRDGKRGGAFCMGISGAKESRVLCNFDGTLDQVSTIAHELGHAFHNDCAYRAGKTPLQKTTPMTLAETASIMCETVIMQAALEHTSDPQEELAILDTILIGDAQVIVDIYSRYLFEKEVFERREKSELSADDFCDIMLKAQKMTYGEALDENFLNKYMWAWKPHYYRDNLSFYNFPYAFGLLFGIGLYAVFQQRGEAFLPDYQALLASTGEASAEDLAGRFGIDLHQRKFWDDSLAVIAKRIERYCQL
jgi:oligoendopeptidase F